MKHIKNYLDVNSNYGVDISFFIDENENYINGVSSFGTETKEEIKMIYDNLKRMGYVKLGYQKKVEIGFIDGGEGDNGTPIIDIYFYIKEEDGIDGFDENNTPVFQVTEQSIKDLGF